MDSMQRARTLSRIHQNKKEKEKFGGERRRYSMVVFFVLQILILVFYSVFTRNTNTASPDQQEKEFIAFTSDYIHYSNLMMMTIIGYTLSYVSSETGGTSSGIIHAAAAFLTLQWGILVFEFWNRVSSGDFEHTYHLDIESLANGCYATITVLISLGCVNGQISVVQGLWSSIFQVVFYAFNHFLLDLLNVSKWERNIFVHLFGVVYGFGMMIGLRPCIHASVVQEKKVGNDFTSKFALLGTLITVVTFPSFNAAFQPVEFQSRVVCNTYLALASGIVCSFAFSVILSPEGRFDYEKIRSGILASGIAICGSIAPLCGPAAAAGVGLVASISGLIVDHYANERLVDVSNTFSSHFVGGSLVGVFGSIIALASAESEGNFFGLQFDDYFDSKSHTSGNYVAAFFVTVFIAFVPSFFISLTLGMGGCSPKKNFTCFEDRDVLSDYDWMAAKSRSFQIKTHKKKESLSKVVGVIFGFKDAYAESEASDEVQASTRQTTLSDFAGFSTEQLEAFFMKHKLEYAARLVLRDGLIGSDITSVDGAALEKYFGVTSKMHIEVLLGKLRDAEQATQE